MIKKISPVFLSAFSAALVAAVPFYAVHAQTTGTQITYPSVSSGTVYPADQYPTAQGQYLKLPSGTRSQAAAPSPSPSDASSSAPSSSLPPLTAPRYVPPPPQPVAALAPTTVASASYSSTDMPPRPAPVVYAQANAPASSRVTPTSYNDLPSYGYDPNADPAHPPYKTPVARDPKSYDSGFGLGTISGFELGLQISDYRYQEFQPSGTELMRITGPTVGLTLDVNETFSGGWFIAGGLRASYGLHDYTGGDININTQVITPSTHNDIDDWMFDVRALGGHDFLFRDAFWGLTDLDLSPYAGVGFRFLYDDSSGDDSNGVPGYERYSHYLYLPIGITPRFRLTDSSRLSVNMEYDLLLYGWQVSDLGDSNPGEGSLTNTQNTGYGLRGSIMYERRSWSVGPYFEFWDIGQSTTNCNNVECGYEPHNQTIEYGLQGKYRF